MLERYPYLSEDSLYRPSTEGFTKRTITPVMASLAELLKARREYERHYEWFVDLARNFHSIQVGEGDRDVRIYGLILRQEMILSLLLPLRIRCARFVPATTLPSSATGTSGSPTSSFATAPPSPPPPLPPVREARRPPASSSTWCQWRSSFWTFSPRGSPLSPLTSYFFSSPASA